MAAQRMDITVFVASCSKKGDVDLLPEGVSVLAQAVMEAEVSCPDRSCAVRAINVAKRLPVTFVGRTSDLKASPSRASTCTTSPTRAAGCSRREGQQRQTIGYGDRLFPVAELAGGEPESTAPGLSHGEVKSGTP